MPKYARRWEWFRPQRRLRLRLRFRRKLPVRKDGLRRCRRRRKQEKCRRDDSYAHVGADAFVRPHRVELVNQWRDGRLARPVRSGRAVTPGAPSPSDCHPRLPPHTILLSLTFRRPRAPVKRIKAIYPGSFDPPTNGHLDLIERGSKIFDELVVAILRNLEKDPLFSVADRRNMLESMTSGCDNVSVETFDGLTVEYAMTVGASVVLRGIRAISDYEYDLQMALMNPKLQPSLATVFMMPAEKYSYISSRLVREVAQLGGNIDSLVPELVAQRLREKMDPALKFVEQAERKSAQRQTRSRKKRS